MNSELLKTAKSQGMRIIQTASNPIEQNPHWHETTESVLSHRQTAIF